MFRIGEFSKLTQVSIRMLRYYDETGLLKPARTDPFTGYRLYAAEQIPQLNKILFLRDLDFGVTEIAAALSRWEDTFLAERLQEKRREIEGNIAREQSKLARIKLAGRDLECDKMAIHCNVTMRSIPSYQVLSLRRVVADYYAEGALWKELAAFAKRQGAPISGNTFTIYHDLDYREQEVDIELCAPVARMGHSVGEFVYRSTEPVAIMACTMVYGSFENIAGVFRSFATWLQQHNQYRMAGTSRQIVHRGQWNEQNPDHYLTEIQIPLETRS